ncbi:MAG: DUF1963 domain-containing protein, partial [Methylococcales bacterium]|nr:DUF1963 domain-containing protein [Methylococcales bacterium]
QIMKKIHDWLTRKERVKAPTPEELEDATKVLESAAKPALLGKIGGARPDYSDTTQSWWGGHFLGKKGEDVPIDSRTGNLMQPVLQIVIQTLPMIPERLSDVALINLWMDLKANDFWEGANGNGFVIREYASLDGLVPIGLPAQNLLPVFPIFWKAPVMQIPSWEDFFLKVPDSVLEEFNGDWFFKTPFAEAFGKLQEKCPVKLGGWPTWIQGAGDFEDETFVFQLDSTDKGQFHIGDAGSVYFFKTSSGWFGTSDCF